MTAEEREKAFEEVDLQRDQVEQANNSEVEKAAEKLKAWLSKMKKNPHAHWKLGQDEAWCRYCGATKASGWGVRE